MRILLDAKDLIDPVEYDRPIPLAEVKSWIERRSARVVLGFANVNDFVGPVFERGDFLNMRALLQRLETLPIIYIREGLIIRDELKAALAAFELQKEPVSIDPYVSRWDEMAYWEGESAAKILVGLRLDEIVYMARNTIQNYKRYAAGLKAQIEAERTVPTADQLKTKDVFINGLPSKLAVHRIDSGRADLPAFGRWLWSNPLRALGHRIHFEAYHQLLKDKSMPVQDGDIADSPSCPPFHT
jgi:hypothetical protein